MQCDAIRERLTDYVEGRLAAELRAEVAAHLQTCASCQAAEWRRRRFDLMLDAFELGGAATRPRRVASLARLAAALCLGLLVGGAASWAFARAPESRAPVAAVGDREFLLALREPSLATPPPSEPIRDVIAAYSSWARSLASEGRLVAAEKLREDGRTFLQPRDGAIVTSSPPRADDEPWLGGFFVLRARDLEEALALARGSPHLRFGGTIEVREIEKTE